MLRPAAKHRDLTLVSTLRTVDAHNEARKEVVEWVLKFVEEARLPTDKWVLDGHAGAGGDWLTWSDEPYDPYFELLHRAKIVVT